MSLYGFKQEFFSILHEGETPAHLYIGAATKYDVSESQDEVFSALNTGTSNEVHPVSTW